MPAVPPPERQRPCSAPGRSTAQTAQLPSWPWLAWTPRSLKERASWGRESFFFFFFPLAPEMLALSGSSQTTFLSDEY